MSTIIFNKDGTSNINRIEYYENGVKNIFTDEYVKAILNEVYEAMTYDPLKDKELKKRIET